MKKLIKKFPNYHERAAFAFDLMKKEFQRGEKSNKIKYLVYDITGLTEVFFNKKIKELKEREFISEKNGEITWNKLGEN